MWQCFWSKRSLRGLRQRRPQRDTLWSRVGFNWEILPWATQLCGITANPGWLSRDMFGQPREGVGGGTVIGMYLQEEVGILWAEVRKVMRRGTARSPSRGSPSRREVLPGGMHQTLSPLHISYGCFQLRKRWQPRGQDWSSGRWERRGGRRLRSWVSRGNWEATRSYGFPNRVPFYAI